MLLYHFVDSKEKLASIKKHGLLSPKALFDIDKSAFMKSTYQIYKDRAEKELGKTPTPEEIIKWLDGQPPLTSEAIYFSLLPIKTYDESYIKAINPVATAIVDSTSLNTPVYYVGEFNGKTTPISQHSNPSVMILKAVLASDIPLKRDNLVFQTIPHAALNCYRITKFKLVQTP